MRQRTSRHPFALTLALALLVYPIAASAAIGDVAADRVLGQPNATTGEPNAAGIDAAGLYHPEGVAFDAAGNLFVVDQRNNRVLGYRSPMTTDRVADIVIGQPDFNSDVENNGGVSATGLAEPSHLAVTPAGDLYVADSENNRVLQYDRPFVTDTVADRVFGQPDFESNDENNGGVNAGSLYYPAAVAIDADGNLWVVDNGNNRVLGYDNPVATQDRIADRVLGQPSFTENTYNNGGVSATSLSGPFAVSVDARRNVWVADFSNNRVLEYDDPVTFDATADHVFGQPSFSSNDPNYTGQVDAAGMNLPGGLTVDRNGNLYVSDTYNHRVLLYTAPIATGDRIADRVFGQPDFNTGTENTGGVSARSMFWPVGLAFDAYGNLVVGDYGNNRILFLEAPTPIVTSIQVKIAVSTRKPKLLVQGVGMLSGSAVVEVDGVPLSTKYKEVAADGSARRLIASDADFNTIVPRGVPVTVTVFNPLTGSRSAPIPFTR